MASMVNPADNPADIPTPTLEEIKERLSKDPRYSLETDEGRERMRVLAEKYRYMNAGANFTPDGFKDWYWCLYGFELPPHALAWVQAFFEEWAKDPNEIRGVMNKAFRGSTKSFVGVAFAMFLHGHFPVGSGLVVQARDEDAKLTARFMSDKIMSGEAWKLCFPRIVPDVERGWSLAGYHIKDTSIPYDKWVDMTSKDHGRHPSFIAVSVSTGSIGMHPSLYLMLDDIHDQKNTASMAEKLAVKKALTADVLPTMSRPGVKPFLFCSYTPWSEDDAYADPLERSGMFRLLNTPAFRFDADGPDRWGKEPVKLTWPVAYSVKTLENWEKLLGKREFGRMYLIDLYVGKGESLRFYSYGAEGIMYDWPMVGGADPTNVDRPAGSDIRQRSHFALAYVAKLPQGGALVCDGVLTPCSQIEAENYILGAQTRFKGWQYTAVENVGGGAVFIQAVRRNSRLRVVESDLGSFTGRGSKIKSKRDRFLLETAPWFENGVVRISDGISPFLDALRRLFDHFFELDDHDPAWDAGDAVYHALKAMPDVLQIVMDEDLPSVYGRHDWGKSPVAGIGESRGYGKDRQTRVSVRR